MKKTVFLTMLDKDEGLAKLLFQEMARYGLEPSGHFWVDDLPNMAWSGASPELAADNCGCWVIVGQAARFQDKATLQGLSCLAVAVQAAHGHGFPILLSPSGGKLDLAALPTPLKSAEVVASGLGVKAVAKVNARRQQEPQEYRLNVHPLPGLGFWLELGPGRDPWRGAMLGASGAVPDAHGVGPAGTIPQTSTLHYPVRGMKLALGGAEYEAWGVKNELSVAESYYVRLNGTPEGLVFGAFPDDDEASVFTVSFT
jgi:hypothetical protein